MLNGIPKARLRSSIVRSLAFLDDLFRSDIDCIQFCLQDLPFLFLFLFLFLQLFIVLRDIFVDEVFYFLYFLLCSTVVMVRALVRTSLFLFLCLGFLSFLPQFIDNLISLPFKVLMELPQIGIKPIPNPLLLTVLATAIALLSLRIGLSITLTPILRMIPLVRMKSPFLLLILFFPFPVISLVSHHFGRVFEHLEIFFYFVSELLFLGAGLGYGYFWFSASFFFCYRYLRVRCFVIKRKSFN